MKPILNSRQLQIFATLARRRSFTQTAKELFITQSAVSHAISTLEEDLGCQLVDRGNRRVQMTPVGELFLRQAEKILEEMETARTEVAQVLRSKEGVERLPVVAGERIAAGR